MYQAFTCHPYSRNTLFWKNRREISQYNCQKKSVLQLIFRPKSEILTITPLSLTISNNAKRLQRHTLALPFLSKIKPYSYLTTRINASQQSQVINRYNILPQNQTQISFRKGKTRSKPNRMRRKIPPLGKGFFLYFFLTR